MAVAEVHPSALELTAFSLGTLGDETQASIEAHVVTCASCQERAAVAPGDTLVELLRSVHAHMGPVADTFVEAPAQVQTPAPLAAVAETEALANAVVPAAPAESDRTEVPDAVPPELACHERYRVVRLLGASGMGVVYLVYHRVMECPVALKVIKPSLMTKPGMVERFTREIKATARLSHPNIVRAFDAEQAGDRHFLVMEYVEGTDLGRLVKEQGPLPVDRACDYIRQAALGLQYAFQQGMIHRDIKPHNLMLTHQSRDRQGAENEPLPDGRGSDRGTIKILDFGLARFADEAVSAAAVTSAGTVLGTVDYIAPEQADNAHQADIRSDIYSLGCTLYHLLAGQPPFPTGTPIQKVMAHAEKKPQPLTEQRPDLPEGIMPVLERMMAKKPKHRYQTPIEVAIALEPFTSATAVAPAPMPRPSAQVTDNDQTIPFDNTPVRGRRRFRFEIAVAILAFLVAGLLGVGVYRIATDKGELVITTESDDVKVVITQGGKQVDVIDTKTDKQIRLALRSGEYELELKGAPEGLKLNIDKATLTRGETVLATIKRADEKVGEVRQYMGHTDGVFTLAISPDGRRAISGSCAPAITDPIVRHWDLETGKELRRLEGHTNGVRSVAFSLDGKEALTASYDKTIRLWDIETGKELWRFEEPTEWVTRAIYSPDGKTVLSGSAAGALRLLDAATGKQIKEFPRHNLLVRGMAFSPDGRFILSGYVDGTLRLWDAAKAEELRRFDGHTDQVTRAVFSPNGRHILSSSMDQTIRLWDVETGKEVRRFGGHTDIVDCVAFSHDGRRALSASYDRTIRLWDVATGKELSRMLGHTGAVYSVVFLPDDRYALSGSADKTMRLWRLPDPLAVKEKP